MARIQKILDFLDSFWPGFKMIFYFRACLSLQAFRVNQNIPFTTGVVN